MLFQEKSDVETPRHIYGDNEASKCLANNKQASNIKNHIDIRDQFIRKCFDEVETELKKVISENNCLDIMTKNIPVETFKRNGENILNREIFNEATIIEVDDDQNQMENFTRNNSSNNNKLVYIFDHLYCGTN